MTEEALEALNIIEKLISKNDLTEIIRAALSQKPPVDVEKLKNEAHEHVSKIFKEELRRDLKAMEGIIPDLTIKYLVARNLLAVSQKPETIEGLDEVLERNSGMHPMFPTGIKHPQQAKDYKILYEAARAYSRTQKPDDWQLAHTETPKGLHTNPDARAWAAYFVEVFPGHKHMEELMVGWFANAMMAMADYLDTQKPDVVCGWQPIEHAKTDGTQYLGVDEEGAVSVFRWSKHNHVPIYGWVRQIELYGEEVDGFDPILFMEFKAPPSAENGGDDGK